MGGKEGARGYLYQTIATVLSSLLDDSWKYVQVEPDTEQDKVDILWEYEDLKTKVVQVKSSQNNIEKSQIVKWLEAIVSNVKNANCYELFLVGNVSDNTSKFISKINRIETITQDNDDFVVLTNIVSYLPKIKIKLENFNLEALEAKIIVNLNKILTKMGHTVNAFILEQISGGVIYQFSKFSTEGRKVSREDYLSIFTEWVYFNYPMVNGNGLVQRSLVVEFYLKNRIDFTDKINAIQAQATRFLPKYRNKLLNLIKEINEIHLPPKTNGLDDSKSPLFHGISLDALRGYQYVEYTDELKDQIIDKTKALLNIDIGREFFYVGDLKKPKIYIEIPYLPLPENQGTEKEKKKGDLIDEFIVSLYDYEKLNEYINYLDNFVLIPLVIRNTGLSSEEDIQVDLKFPSNIKVLTYKNILLPDFNIIDELVGESGLLNYIMKPERDYQVEDYSVNYSTSYIDYDLFLSRFDNDEQKRKKKINKFYHFIEELFSNEIFEEENETIIRYNFSDLNAKKNMYFPSFIFVDASDSFSFQYEISSKNIGNKITGNLYIEFNEEQF